MAKRYTREDIARLWNKSGLSRPTDRPLKDSLSCALQLNYADRIMKRLSNPHRPLANDLPVILPGGVTNVN